jgi:hypothetical protein
MAQRHVKLTGDVEGSYVIEESLADGRLVVAPEWPSKETSVEAILERAGGERMSPEEFDKHFGHLPTDDEGVDGRTTRRVDLPGPLLANVEFEAWNRTVSA